MFLDIIVLPPPLFFGSRFEQALQLLQLHVPADTNPSFDIQHKEQETSMTNLNDAMDRLSDRQVEFRTECEWLVAKAWNSGVSYWRVQSLQNAEKWLRYTF